MAKWLDNAIFYQIYPQSFFDTNGDGIGDIRGIISKLDYIKSIGFNALWLNPCFVSPFADAGYDVADYYTVAPRYGTNEDLKQLFEELHKRDMHILLDLVPGHTSVEHKWFKESMKADINEFTDRYVWTDDIWEGPEGMNNIRGFSERNGCCGVNFFSTQPALNYGFYKITRPWQMSPDDPGPTATLNAMKDIMRFWLSMGCDGFRVDMAGSLVKNDEDGKGTIALWKKIRAFLDEEFPEAAMVSEWGEPDKSLEGGFHMDFLLHFGPSHYNDLFRCEHPYFGKEGKGNAAEFVSRYVKNYEKSGGKGLICIPSSNHDMERISRNFDTEELKICFGFILAMPGAPFVYYGDEIGMKYLENIKSVEGGYGRTGSRSPMQWDSTANAGFSSAAPEKLYIQIDPDKNRPTAKKAISNESSLLNEIKKLIEIRQANPALQSNGKIRFVYAEENAYPLAFIRSLDGEEILVVINPADRQCGFDLDATADKVLYQRGKVTVQNGKVTAAAQSVAYIKLK